MQSGLAAGQPFSSPTVPTGSAGSTDGITCVWSMVPLSTSVQPCFCQV
jgi:hypothetical protein